jgi:hypothetical protein
MGGGLSLTLYELPSWPRRQPLDVQVVEYSSRVPAKERTAALEAFRAGAAKVLVAMEAEAIVHERTQGWTLERRTLLRELHGYRTEPAAANVRPRSLCPGAGGLGRHDARHGRGGRDVRDQLRRARVRKDLRAQVGQCGGEAARGVPRAAGVLISLVLPAPSVLLP